MVDVRVSAASGTASDWASSPLILGLGQLIYETDTQILRVGDGNNVASALPVLAKPGGIFPLNDGTTTTGSVWSSQKVQDEITAAIQTAQAYTDAAVPVIGQPRLDVAFQASDGTWGVRPNAYCVFAFGTAAPSWLVANVDAFFQRGS